MKNNSNRQIIRPALNLMTLMRADLEEAINAAAAAGFESVELWTDTLSRYLQDHEVNGLHRLLRKNQVKVLTIGDVESVTFQTPEEFKELNSQCSHLAAVAREIGCPTLVVSGSVRPRRTDDKKVMAEVISVLAKLLDTVESEGIGLSLTFGGFSWCSVNSLDQVSEAVSHYRDRNLTMVIDTFDLHAARVDTQSLLRMDLNKMSLVRLSDCGDIPAPLLTDTCRLFPGEGAVDLRAMLRPVMNAGFAGALSLKALSPRFLDMSPHEIAAEAMETIKPYLDMALLNTGVEK